MLNSKEDYINQFSTLNDSLNNKLGSNYFEIKPILAFDVRRSLQTLNPNKASCLDGIGPNMLTLCGDSLVALITFIINKRISGGVFPCTFKTASVIPLHKSRPKSDPNNYIGQSPSCQHYLKYSKDTTFDFSY